MKWDTIEPTQNVFSFTHADYEVSWALNRSQVVRGHNFGTHYCCFGYATVRCTLMPYLT